MPIKKKTAKKPVAVNRKFLLRLADKIYNPKTRTFLRLCDGSLQNGPDPTDKSRPMHCGLGELYFTMTGKQPEFTGVGEDDVVNLAVKLSPLNGVRVAAREDAIAGVKSLDLPSGIEKAAIEAIENLDDEELNDDESQFREILADIPTSNDDDYGDSCSLTDFRNRSKRVASKLREAAELLPRHRTP